MIVIRKAATIFLVIVLLTSLARVCYCEKKLIEFGWDEPDTRFMREHIKEMEQTPFDGCVFTVAAKNADGTSTQFISECWGRRKFNKSELQNAVEDLKATRFKKFTD